MVVKVEIVEVDQLSTAIAGLDIEYVRTNKGFGPNQLTFAQTDDMTLSVGEMGFSATANTEIPDGIVVFGVITKAVSGGVWCGTQLAEGQLFVFGPGTTFVAFEPAGLAATLLTVPVDALANAGGEMGIGEPLLSRCVRPLLHRPETAELAAGLWAATDHPNLVEQPAGSAAMLEGAVRALVDVDARATGVLRRLDRRRIVSDCLEFVESSGSSQFSMGDLCRAANASASCVRQAFVEVFDMPPTQYFQYRLLSRLRVELLRADPHDETVTRIASSLGVTHLSRTSGRYRSVFGEVPSQTLLRTA